MKIISNLILIFTLSFHVQILSQNADINLLREINSGRNIDFDDYQKTISNSVTPFVIGTPVLMYSLGLLHKNTTTKQKGIYLAQTILGATILSAGLKYGIQRERPFITYPDIQAVVIPNTPSFPSGHTTKSFALATSLSLAYPKWYIIAPSFLWASSVGYSRMHLGVHYPSDVISGALIGCGTAFLTYKLNHWINKKTEQKLFYDGF